MGLDSIEILVKVEKTFGITIPDNEAEKIITVGDFHDAVWRHLEPKHSEKCKSQALFYKIRQSAFNRLEFPKNDFKPVTSLNTIFPLEGRRQAYLNFAKANDLTFPDLKLTTSWRIFLNAFGLLIIIGGLGIVIIMILFFAYSKWLLLIPVIGIILTNLVSGILNPKRIIIKPGTIREFINEVLVMNYATLPDKDEVNRGEVETIINQVISDMAGLELEEITVEKKIHDDLGID